MSHKTVLQQEQSWADDAAKRPRRARKVGDLLHGIGVRSRGALKAPEKSNRVFGKSARGAALNQPAVLSLFPGNGATTGRGFTG